MKTTEHGDSADDNPRDILDELDALVDAASVEPAVSEHCTAAPAGRLEGPQEAPEGLVEPTPAPAPTARVIPLADARTRRNLRADLVFEGLHAARSAVAVIRKTFDEDAADFDDAVKALPVVHRLIEHVEKIEAARNKTPDLHTLDVRIESGMISIRHVQAASETRMLDIDPDE